MEQGRESLSFPNKNLFPGLVKGKPFFYNYISDSSATQLESAAQQLLLAWAERHMLQKEIKQLCEQAPLLFFFFSKRMAELKFKVM